MAQEQEIRKLADLTPDSNNYNKGTEKGRKLIGKSLKKLGAGRSILIDKDGNVIAGNKTLEGAAAAGIDEVIVVKTTGRQIVAVQRTDLEIGSKKGREMALADNATGAANLSWDLEAMTADGWTESDLSGWGVDLPEAEPVKAEAFEDDFEPPAEIEEIKTDIVLGDLFEVGPHRLLCGDSTKAEDVERLMGGEKADMVFTDPPYGISHSGKGIKGAAKENDFGEILGDSDVTVAVDSFKLCQSMFPKSMMIFWGANYYSSCLPNGFGWLVWDKQREGDVFSGAELAYVNKGVKVDIFRHQWYGMIKSSEMGEKRVHPTQKPIALVEWCFSNYKAGKNILDLFLGSGTTMVAAHQLNRRCFGMEISPKYCQVILDRILKLDPNIEIKKNGEPYNNR